MNWSRVLYRYLTFKCRESVVRSIHRTRCLREMSHDSNISRIGYINLSSLYDIFIKCSYQALHIIKLVKNISLLTCCLRSISSIFMLKSLVWMLFLWFKGLWLKFVLMVKLTFIINFGRYTIHNLCIMFTFTASNTEVKLNFWQLKSRVHIHNLYFDYLHK